MTKPKRSLTDAGIVIETRNRTNSSEPIVVHRAAEFGDLTVSCMRHERDNTVTLNFKRSAGRGEHVYMDMGLHLTPEQAMAISQVIKGCCHVGK